MSLLRQPLVQFLIIGAVIAAAYGLIGDWWGAGSERAVTITAAEIARLEATFRAQWNRPPMPEELDGLIRSQVRERVLYREALAMGLGDDDPVVRRVISQKLELLYNDLVELSLSPTDQELRAYFAANPDQYQPPPRVTMTQVFLNPDQRQTVLQDAEQMLAELREAGAGAEGAEDLGDSLMLQRYYPQHTETEIARLFGAEFAAGVLELAPEQWHGPVLSGYGVHLVYIHGRIDPPMPSFESVEDMVRQDWIGERRRDMSEQFFNELLDSYEVIIEQPEGAVAEPASAKR